MNANLGITQLNNKLLTRNVWPLMLMLSTFSTAFFTTFVDEGTTVPKIIIYEKHILRGQKIATHRSFGVSVFIIHLLHYISMRITNYNLHELFVTKHP